jgi:hypothetical protein
MGTNDTVRAARLEYCAQLLVFDSNLEPFILDISQARGCQTGIVS